MWKKILEALSAAAGAVMSFFCKIPPVVYILLIVMSLDFLTGVITGFLGMSKKTESGGVSSKAAFKGLLKKVLILIIVALGALVDWAISTTADIQFAAVMYASALWFIASEGLSILENVSLIGIPVPKILIQGLDILKKKGDGQPEPTELKTSEERNED